MRQIRLAAVLLLSLFALACSSPTANNTNTASNNDAANTAKDSVDDLSMMIRLPFAPEEATWKETTLGERRLAAVLLYSNEDAAKFASQLAAQGQPKPDTVAAEDWFPSELISQSDIGGESVLKGQTYNARDVIQPPYTEGKITRIADSNYFVVQLTAK